MKREVLEQGIGERYRLRNSIATTARFKKQEDASLWMDVKVDNLSLPIITDLLQDRHSRQTRGQACSAHRHACGC